MCVCVSEEVGSGEDLSALLGEGPSEGVSEGVSEGGMAIVNTGEIVPLDTSVKDPKFSSRCGPLLLPHSHTHTHSLTHTTTTTTTTTSHTTTTRHFC